MSESSPIAIIWPQVVGMQGMSGLWGSSIAYILLWQSFSQPHPCRHTDWSGTVFATYIKSVQLTWFQHRAYYTTWMFTAVAELLFIKTSSVVRYAKNNRRLWWLNHPVPMRPFYGIQTLCLWPRICSNAWEITCWFCGNTTTVRSMQRGPTTHEHYLS